VRQSRTSSPIGSPTSTFDRHPRERGLHGALADLLEAATPADLCEKFGGNGFLVMLERGTGARRGAWPRTWESVNAHTFASMINDFARVTVAWDCCLRQSGCAAAIGDAVSDTRATRARGNQMYVVDKSDTDTRVQAYDKIWVQAHQERR